MSAYANACDLKVDILWRAGEPTDGTSDYDITSLVYLNRAYQTLCLGGAELAPEVQEDWWWLRKSPPGVLILQPAYATGTITVTNNNTAVTFSAAPSFTAQGWFLRIAEGNGDIFRVSAHIAGATVATLDSVYTGASASVAFTLFKLEYDIASDVLRLISPMRAYRAERRYEILGVDLMALDYDYPLAAVDPGIPDRFAAVDENTVRFNRYGGTTSTEYIRAEYDYLYMPPELESLTTSIPVVPLHWRHVLSDWGTFWLMMDKNDNRADAVGLAAKNGLKAMATENRHKLGAQGRGAVGNILPRQDEMARSRGPLRTSSGLIIG
jgi:hypothetical protein